MLLRASPILVAVALSSGCLIDSRPPEGSVAIYWAFWAQSLGDIGGATSDKASVICTVAAVHDVRITLTTPAGEVLLPSNGPCMDPSDIYDVPGAAFESLEPGSWGYFLEGRRGGVTVFEANGEFEVRDGERTIVADFWAGPPNGFWDVVVPYTTGTCAVGDRLRFDLIDSATLAKTFSTDDARVNPNVDVPCGSGTFTIPSVAPGSYEFSDWVQVAANGSAKAYGVCRESWTQSNTASTTLPAVDLTASVPSPVGNPGVCP